MTEMELVARVDDRQTVTTSERRLLSNSAMAPLIPMERSFLVVRDFALSKISPVSRSIITASVYVPPVSNPSPSLLIFIRLLTFHQKLGARGPHPMRCNS